MSLNIPAHGYYPQNDVRPPPTWMNNWGMPGVYPYQMGMVPMMNPGIK